MGAGPSKDTTEALSTAATTTEVSVSLRQLHDRLKHGRGMSEEQLEAARLAFNELAVREGLRGGAPIPLSSAFPLLYGGIDFKNVELVVWSKGNTLNKDYADNIERKHILYIEHADQNTVKELVDQYLKYEDESNAQYEDYFQNLLGFICSDWEKIKDHIPGLRYWAQYDDTSGGGDVKTLSASIKQIQTIVCPVQPLDTDSYKGIVSGCLDSLYESFSDVHIQFEQTITKGFTKDSHTSLMRQILNNSDGAKTGNVSINLKQYLEDSNETVRQTLTWAIHLKSITIKIEKL